MNYRHAYHAGNFADVFKHWALTLLLAKLREKDAPFFVLDTHAGIGRYDLLSPEMQKTREYESGIGLLLRAGSQPESMAAYLECVKKENAGGALRFYPGSPKIIARFLRPQDRLHCCELHPEDFKALRRSMAGNAQVSVHHLDAYAAMKSLLPPKENRGLALIDPAFEAEDELARVAAAMEGALGRFAHGMYALWFPIKTRAPVEMFYAAMKTAGAQKILAAEFLLHADLIPGRLNGCGMLFVNPPWRLEETLRDDMPRLLAALGAADTGGARVMWLANT